MNKIVALLMVLLVGGCASTYVLSDSAKQALAGMNKQTAEKNIEQLSRRSHKAGGLCLAGTLTTRPGSVPRIQDGKLHFAASYEKTTGYSTSPSGTGIAVSRHYTVHKGEFAINLHSLKSVRIVSGNKIPACQYDGSGKIVIVADTEGIDGMINVSEADLDLLMASLHYLSPKAKLSQGVGF
jgi:hypothetical protein